MSRNIPKNDKEVLAAYIYRPILCSPDSNPLQFGKQDNKFHPKKDTMHPKIDPPL